MKNKTYRPLTAEEHEALVNFAREYGDEWKRHLHIQWCHIIAPETLQPLLYSHGVLWLRDYELTPLVTVTPVKQPPYTVYQVENNLREMLNQIDTDPEWVRQSINSIIARGISDAPTAIGAVVEALENCLEELDSLAFEENTLGASGEHVAIPICALTLDTARAALAALKGGAK